MNEPTFHVGVSRRSKCPDGSYTDFTINLSGIPLTADRSVIEMMLDGANTAMDLVSEELDCRIRNMIGPHTFHLPVAPLRSISHFDIEAVERAHAETPVPDAADVRMSSSVFGVEIPMPLPSWHEEPLTQGGTSCQLTAVNAGLTQIGYGKKARHPSALAMVQAYGPIAGHGPRDGLGSIYELTKAEACIILSFLALADDKALTALKMAIEVGTCTI